MGRIRFWFKGLRYRLLDRFAEVRELRTLQRDFEQRARALSAKELEHRKHAEQAEQADVARAKSERELADTKRGLELMTEARLNAERAVDVIRGQMETLRDTCDREIASMKQMVDWFGLEGRGRQVFGTAPLTVRPKDETVEPPPARISARHLVQQQTAEFLREAEKRLAQQQTLPNNGAEYSSTSRAVEESAA